MQFLNSTYLLTRNVHKVFFLVIIRSTIELKLTYTFSPDFFCDALKIPITTPKFCKAKQDKHNSYNRVTIIKKISGHLRVVSGFGRVAIKYTTVVVRMWQTWTSTMVSDYRCHVKQP